MDQQCFRSYITAKVYDNISSNFLNTILLQKTTTIKKQTNKKTKQNKFKTFTRKRNINVQFIIDKTCI